MKTAAVIDYLDSVFHPEYQEDYDNSGYLVGDPLCECTGALVALDLTPAVVAEAIDLGLNLIVTHHPFIFLGLKRITTADEAGRMVHDLVRHGISVYAAHTNLDNLPWGVSHALGQRLGLRDMRVLHPDGAGIGAGMVGELPEAAPLRDFLVAVKQRLRLPTVRYAPDLPGLMVRRVALCGGSGGFLIGDALAAGADLYLTADLKYHDFQRALGPDPLGTGHPFAIADIGHYESEQFAKEIIYSAISEKFSNFACQISCRQESVVSYI